MYRTTIKVVLLFITSLGVATPRDFPLTEKLGGMATVFEKGFFAFRRPSPTLNEAELLKHIRGDRIFEAQFVSDPLAVTSGLGPHFFNTSCRACHVLDGRGAPVVGQDFNRSQAVLKVRVRWSAQSDWLEIPSTDRAVVGVKPRTTVALSWKELDPIQLSGGERVSLRRPILNVSLNSFERFPYEIAASLRVAPPVYGLGLLEALDQKDIEENYRKNPQARLGDGRFGWKGDAYSVLFQTAKAFFNDMGLSSWLFPEEDQSFELSDQQVVKTAFYVSSLAVPARRSVNKELELLGEKTFRKIGCADCHQVSWRTSHSPVSGFSNQVIHPFTDLLLHDMGEDLSEVPGSADEIHRYWRTPPLWGIGLAKKLNNKVGFLHDGRARTYEEAILWHGGEAESAKQSYIQLQKDRRKALQAFLNSL